MKTEDTREPAELLPDYYPGRIFRDAVNSLEAFKPGEPDLSTPAGVVAALRTLRRGVNLGPIRVEDLTHETHRH